MKKSTIAQEITKNINTKTTLGWIAIIVLAQEMFALVNSFKWAFVLPTLENVLNKSRIESWRYSNGSLCLHYGKFLWSLVAFGAFMFTFWVVWKLVHWIAKKI